MKLFGFEIKRSASEQRENENLHSIVLPEEDGVNEISSTASGYMAYGLNTEQNIRNENELITKYRNIANQTEVDKAIQDIINEAFSYDENSFPVEINLNEIDKKVLPEKTKKKIKEEFDYILNLMNFGSDSYEIFRRWYVDGRIYYEKGINKDKPKEGIKKLKYIDPRKIKKIREIDKTKNRNIPEFVYGNLNLSRKYTEYYIYNPEGLDTNNFTGVPIAPDTITYVTSGILDEKNNLILSHLHKAIKPFNNLRMLEDSLIIYRLARAPERKIFNVEIGTLPKSKAEEYMVQLKEKFKRKTMYDPVTGELQDNKYFMTMMEDYWFAKREGVGTTVDTLSGGQNLGEIEDVLYFKKKLYESLNVPVSRLETEQAQFNIGRSSEITRDELKFGKFISRLRKRFSFLFSDILKDHLILKGIVTQEEWDDFENLIFYDYREDTFFSELKWSEIYKERLATLRDSEEYVGRYFSKGWIQRTVLQMSDDEIKDMQNEIDKEKKENPEEFGDDQFGDDDGYVPPQQDKAPPQQQFAPKDDEPEEEETING